MFAVIYSASPTLVYHFMQLFHFSIFALDFVCRLLGTLSRLFWDSNSMFFHLAFRTPIWGLEFIPLRIKFFFVPQINLLSGSSLMVKFNLLPFSIFYHQLGGSPLLSTQWNLICIVDFAWSVSLHSMGVCYFREIVHFANLSSYWMVDTVCFAIWLALSSWFRVGNLWWASLLRCCIIQ